jgi:hypothetical protein
LKLWRRITIIYLRYVFALGGDADFRQRIIYLNIRYLELVVVQRLILQSIFVGVVRTESCSRVGQFQRSSLCVVAIMYPVWPVAIVAITSKAKDYYKGP